MSDTQLTEKEQVFADKQKDAMATMLDALTPDAPYTIISTKDDTIIVSVGKSTYQIDKSSFETIKAVLTTENAVGILDMMVSTNAKTAKAFDPEKAQREAEKAVKIQALADFEKELEGWLWSDSVEALAQTVTDLRIEQSQIEETPFSISLEDYSRNSPSKGCERGQYRFTYYKGVPSLVVGLNEPLPKAMTIAQEVDVALHNFRTAAANEIEVPSVLRSENTHKDFDVNDIGNIVYNVKVSTRTGNGGGPRKRVEYIDEGNNVTIHESKTALGEYLGATSKWPHASKEVNAAFASGKATFLDDQD